MRSALGDAIYDYINTNNLWSLGCVRDGIYKWPAVDASEYSQTPPAAVLAQSKATYPGDHGTIYVFGAHRDDTCTVTVPVNPYATRTPLSVAAADPENLRQMAAAALQAAGAPSSTVESITFDADSAPLATQNVTGGIRLTLTNVTNPGAVGFAAGDRFGITVTGGPSGQTVSLTAIKDGVNLGTQNLGTIGANGGFSFSDVMPASAAGHWEEDYRVGGQVVAHFSFDVGLAVPAPTQVPAPTGPGSGNAVTPTVPTTSGYFDSILNTIAPAGSVGTFLKNPVGGYPLWMWAAGGLVAWKFLGSGGRR